MKNPSDNVNAVDEAFDVVFPFDNKVNLLDEIGWRVSCIKEALEKMESRIDQAYYTSDPGVLEEVGQCFFELNFNCEQKFSENWAYVCAKEGVARYQKRLAYLLMGSPYGQASEYPAAIHWLKKAANNGATADSIEACSFLAEIYQTGIWNIEPDPVEAEFWRSQAEALKVA